MKKNLLIHIPHSSLYIPENYKSTSLLSPSMLDKENLFMCDFKVADLLDDKSQAIIFPYSRLYYDVERFKGEMESMNKYGILSVFCVILFPGRRWRFLIFGRHRAAGGLLPPATLKRIPQCLFPPSPVTVPFPTDG